MSDEIRIRTALPAEELAVRRLLDGAVLAYEGLEERIAAGQVLVAIDDGTARGVLLWEPGASHTRIRALAVHPRHRRRGIATALVGSLEPPLEARFDADLRPFYEHLGFIVSSTDGGRCRGVKRGPG